jgi:hypothetical protein
MTIGTLTPGSPTPVTPDASPAYYDTFNGPAVDGLIVATDVLEVAQLALNVQAQHLNMFRVARYYVHCPDNPLGTPLSFSTSSTSFVEVVQGGPGYQTLSFGLTDLQEGDEIEAILIMDVVATTHNGQVRAVLEHGGTRIAGDTAGVDRVVNYADGNRQVTIILRPAPLLAGVVGSGTIDFKVYAKTDTSGGGLAITCPTQGIAWDVKVYRQLVT